MRHPHELATTWQVCGGLVAILAGLILIYVLYRAVKSNEHANGQAIAWIMGMAFGVIILGIWLISTGYGNGPAGYARLGAIIGLVIDLVIVLIALAIIKRGKRERPVNTKDYTITD